jgi:Uma2 family endonuclease
MSHFCRFARCELVIQCGMVHPLLPNRLLSLKEYFAFEENAPWKHEFVSGHVYVMAAVTARHALIVGNIVQRLRGAAAGGPCRVFSDSMMLQAAADVVYYPDAMVVCNDLDLSVSVVRDPCFVVEVTSPSTQRYDKTEKRDAYLRIPSLQAYLVVEQAWRRVDLHWRNPTGVWESAIVREGAVSIPCPETRLTLDEIYEGLPALTVREMEAIGYAVS